LFISFGLDVWSFVALFMWLARSSLLMFVHSRSRHAGSEERGDGNESAERERETRDERRSTTSTAHNPRPKA
jgi:hypothetical protein